MVTREDIESFLDRLASEGASYTEVEPGLWIVKPGGMLDADVVVNYSPPVALLRVKVMDLPKDERAAAGHARRSSTPPTSCTGRTAFSLTRSC
jgi:hypothetical protein